MQAKKLYAQLEKDFITPEMDDDWAPHMQEVEDFLCDNFKTRSMGLVCDFARTINKVYCAVFPEEKVLQAIVDDDARDALLFLHHPSIWDIRQAPNVFQQMDRRLLEELKRRRVAIYTLHVPLDNYGPFSTSNTLARALNLEVVKAFAEYHGGLAGVIAKTKAKSLEDLKRVFEKAVGHRVAVYNYGPEKIPNQLVAVVAGGGNDMEVVPPALKEGAKVIITGISSRNSHSEETPLRLINLSICHPFKDTTYLCVARKLKIN